jgi:hypothetical protein
MRIFELRTENVVHICFTDTVFKTQRQKIRFASVEEADCFVNVMAKVRQFIEEKYRGDIECAVLSNKRLDLYVKPHIQREEVINLIAKIQKIKNIRQFIEKYTTLSARSIK